MYKIALAALTLGALLGGPALADESPFVDHALGPAAYPDWQAQWARLRASHSAGLTQPGPGAQPANSVTQPGTNPPGG